MSKWFVICSIAAVCLLAGSLSAHHGVASLGIAGLEGPGAPVETSTSATLPAGNFFGYLKLDYASFEKFTPERDDEGDYNVFWMFGLGYGITSWFSGYFYLPYSSKVLEDNSYNTSGFTDVALMGVLGFKYDEGLRLVPESESLDDLEDWHFTAYGGLTLPTGDANVSDSSGAIDPGMSLGFGAPSFMGGGTTTKMFSSRGTFVFDVSYIGFTEYEYADGNTMKFGSEFRVNAALVGMCYTNLESKFRFDAILEANYLDLGRDRADGVDELATGGKMIYIQPGFRLYKDSTSAALGIKIPTWTDLNEEEYQQGAEGTENYRIDFTFSVLF